MFRVEYFIICLADHVSLDHDSLYIMTVAEHLKKDAALYPAQSKTETRDILSGNLDRRFWTDTNVSRETDIRECFMETLLLRNDEICQEGIEKKRILLYNNICDYVAARKSKWVKQSQFSIRKAA